MKLALIGGTCTGKTSAMKKIAEMRNCATRSCGGEVLAAAKRLGIHPDEVGKETHCLIDQETREFVENVEALVVDGRFLDLVLAEQTGKIFLVNLVADEKTRSMRAANRLRESSESTEDFVATSDARDDRFRSLMYAGENFLKPDIAIDTSSLAVEEVAKKILFEYDRAKK